MNWKQFLSIGTLALLLYTLYEQNNAINKYKDLVKNSKDAQYLDSLNLELFNAKNTVGRYEVTLDLLKEQDSIGASKFTKILESETE